MSASRISCREIRQIALQARLSLSEEEMDALAIDLGRLLEVIERLHRQPLGPPGEPDAVESTLSVARDDLPRPSLDRDVVLSAAPVCRLGHFVVPRVLA